MTDQKDQNCADKNIFCWVDIPVANLDRAIGFYSRVIAKEVTKVSEHGFDFALLAHEDNNVSGCLTVMPDRKPSKNGPLVYINVEGRLDEAAIAVASGGGSIVTEKQSIGPYGFRTIVEDTEGNVVALYSSIA